ncbi:choice-of-anchor B family protein [Mangrovimonas cancribranchiae]|uniref:Choice-of-anchor B family protein n=1 Tax=Mangrovimonas cancribranchiae TaxID=3080055 RepID=A0AAU6P795_9FLAO
MITKKSIIKTLLITLSFSVILSCDNEPVAEIAVIDTDNDGVPDSEDNCPQIANANQADTNGNGIGDACESNTPQPLAECIDGMADIYPCEGYDLIGYMSLDELAEPNAEGNDCWGWTDPITGKEYGLICSTQGTAFVDISNPTQPQLIGKLASANPGNNGNIWRDVKVYNNHAFIVSEATGHGMQVFDLTRLRNITQAQDFTADTHFTDFGSAHNIVINEDSGYAYIVGTSRSGTYAGGPLFINIQNPLSPISEGGLHDYAHDAQVITYNGPDNDYLGQEILIGSNEDEIVIANVSDKSNPTIISTIAYNNIGYVHQGWFTENMEYFILGDELDEQYYGNNTRTLVFNFSDLDNPSFHLDYLGPTPAIDHNGYVKNNTFFLANYSAGVRFINTSNLDSGSMTESGYFDTYPESNSANFQGAWSVYPYFSSGNIIVSDIDRGLFIIRRQN